MHFNQYGKTFQLRIESANDLKEALALDESLWVATSAPAHVFRCDKTFISMLDYNHSGRIHTTDLKKAIQWMLEVLSDYSNLSKKTNHISISAINRNSPDGVAITQSAEYILNTLQPDDKGIISLKLIRRFISKQKEQPLNGDGILVAEATENPQTIQLIHDIIATVGGSTDASGKTGVTSENLATFRQEVSDAIEWRGQASDISTEGKSPLLPFGDQTAVMYKKLSLHQEKVDTFFEQCRSIRFDATLMRSLTNNDKNTPEVNLSNASDIHAHLQTLPLATPNANKLLPLTSDDINPAYAEWMDDLKQNVFQPILGGELPASLSHKQWLQIKATLQPYAEYLQQQKGKRVEKLSNEQLQFYSQAEHYAEVEKLIQADKAVAEKLKAIHEVERLCLYHQHLLRFANNFISFSELYHPPIKAIFEEGSVQIDGRWFDLVLRVDDITKHSAIAKSGNIFTLYLEVTEQLTKTTYHIAVPVTSGTKGNLAVGKRGVFFDVRGQEHDAVVVKIIDNPISLREALAAPFVRLRDFVLGKIESISGTLEKNLQKSTDTLLQNSNKKVVPVSTPTNNSGPAGILIGLSLSAAAIGSAFAFITKTLSGLTSFQLIAGLIGAAAVVAIPVSLIAIIKLRRQDLSSLLEGCGWAINARMRFDRQQRRSFTRRVPYPATATGTPQHTWLTRAFIALILIATLLGIRHGCRTLDNHPQPPTPTSHPAKSSPSP